MGWFVLAETLEVLDNKFIEGKRKEMNLPNPCEFENRRISQQQVSELIPLLLQPFDELAIRINSDKGFEAKGVPLPLQLNRLYQVFGVEHVHFEHSVVEQEIPASEVDKGKYYYKVYVTLKIGNWTQYVNAVTNEPMSKFLEYYSVVGVGSSSHASRGTAEKSAVANGKKECLKNMGLLSYLYVSDEDGDNDDFYTSSLPLAKIELLDRPYINDIGTVYLKVRARDIDKDEEVEAIVYKENQMNKEEHQKMIQVLKKYQSSLVEGKVIQVEYREKEYSGKMQYIINRILFTKENK